MYSADDKENGSSAIFRIRMMREFYTVISTCVSQVTKIKLGFAVSSAFHVPQMTKNISAAQAHAEAEKQKRNKAGLDAVLASLQAAKKVNVLDKSRSDWDTFKQSDTKARSLPPLFFAPLQIPQ